MAPDPRIPKMGGSSQNGLCLCRPERWPQTDRNPLLRPGDGLRRPWGTMAVFHQLLSRRGPDVQLSPPMQTHVGGQLGCQAGQTHERFSLGLVDSHAPDPRLSQIIALEKKGIIKYLTSKGDGFEHHFEQSDTKTEKKIYRAS